MPLHGTSSLLGSTYGLGSGFGSDPPAATKPKSYSSWEGGGSFRGSLDPIAPNAKTSKSDPLRVVFAPSPTTGRLGLTICPGKKGSSIHSYAWDRDLGADLDRLKNTYNATVLVSLIEDHELVSLGVPNLVAEAEKRGIHVERFPIPDLSVPSDEAKTRKLVKKLAELLEEGKNVVIHCRGGNGRTGLIATLVLEELGMSANQALKNVRSVRPNAVETDSQESYVANFTP